MLILLAGALTGTLLGVVVIFLSRVCDAMAKIGNYWGAR